MNIVIVGAGIVGLASAWWLARDGHAVTVIESRPGVGQGTSRANGAQLSYAYVAPLASPSVLRSLPGWLLSLDGPVRLRPSFTPAQTAWLLRFLAACTQRASDDATRKTLALAALSRASLHEMLAATPIAFGHRRNGKLVVQSSASGMRAAERQMRLQATLGCRQEALTRAECLALEPALGAIGRRLVGGIYTTDEEVGDCRALCEGLHAALAGPPWSVRFLLATEVRCFQLRRGAVAGVVTSAGEVEADAVVLAAGPQAAALARSARLALPIQPVRGYSITARLRPGAGPVRSITDAARKVVYAPLDGALRVAGFAEIDGGRDELRPGRIAALATALAETFPDSCAPDDLHAERLQPWSGLRPATPTGLPLIGHTRRPNLLLNVGHGPLGFTLAAGSARLLADLVAGRMPQVEAGAFAVM